jgi:hypothetical protein
MAQLICSKCGCEARPIQMRGEESLVRLADGNILAANRWFDAECPQCGAILQNKMGHHGTIQTKRLKDLFPKDRLPLLRARLSVKEFRRLKSAREGKQALTDEELTRYVGILGTGEETRSK